MTWQILIIISAIFAALRSSLIKKITAYVKPIQTIPFFYTTALIVAIGTSFLVFDTNPFIGGTELWIVRAFGVIFAIGVFAQFESIKINLTKTIIFTSYQDILSIILSVILLGELKLFDPRTFGGIAAILGIILFVISIYIGNVKKKDSKKIDKKFLFWLILSMSIMGLGSFFVKLLVTDVKPIVLLVNQYIGSIVIIWLIAIIKKVDLKISKKPFLLSLLNGVVSASAVGLSYLAIELAPVSLVSPISNTLRVLITIPIGLFFFKEVKKFTRQEKLSLVIGSIGLLLLILRSFV